MSIMHNSKITVKLNMNSLDKEIRVKQVAMKSYDIHYHLKNAIKSGGVNKIYNPSQNNFSDKLSEINDFRIDKNIQKIKVE